MYADIYEEFNKTNRFWIAYTEQDRGAIIRTSVFCVDNTCFPSPGHKYKISEESKLFTCDQTIYHRL